MFPEGATGCVLQKKVFLKISQISQKKHLCWSLFLIKLQAFRAATLLKEILTQVFSCEYCKIFKNTYSEEYLRTTTCISEIQTTNNVIYVLAENFQFQDLQNIFLPLQPCNVSSTKLIFAFASFSLTRHFQCFFLLKSEQIKRFKSSSKMCTHRQCVSSGFIQQNCAAPINNAPQHH